MTAEERKLLERVARMPKMDATESAALRAALATIDSKAAELAMAKADRQALKAAIPAMERMAAELELLRPELLDTIQYDDCNCPHCVRTREWRARFGKGA